jgi:radical SAM superfamily enzyme YgiQ (UPF0313 family)
LKSTQNAPGLWHPWPRIPCSISTSAWSYRYGFASPAEQDAETFAQRVIEIDPQLIGISLTTRQWLRARNLMGSLRLQTQFPVVAGGLHATFSPEHVLEHPGFDFVCLGEGEDALLELVQRLESGGPTDNIRTFRYPVDGGRNFGRPSNRLITCHSWHAIF